MEKKSPYSMVVAADYALVSPGKEVHFGHIQARQLLWNRKGHGTIIVDDVNYLMDGSDFILCPYFSKVSYFNSGESVWNIGGICIVLDVLDRNFFNAFYGSQTESGEHGIHRNYEWKNFETVKVGTLRDNRLLESLFEYTMQFRNSKSFTSLSLHHLALLLIEGIEQHFERIGREMVLPPQFQLMLQHANALEEPNIDKLCRIFHCSRSTLFRKFKEYLNFSPHQWIIEKKLQRTAEILYQTDLPVKQIAQMEGFEDENYFSRIFRKKYGVSPIAYRKRNSMFGRKF
jgi:AraC-like DNA-binding protein